MATNALKSASTELANEDATSVTQLRPNVASDSTGMPALLARTLKTFGMVDGSRRFSVWIGVAGCLVLACVACTSPANKSRLVENPVVIQNPAAIAKFVPTSYPPGKSTTEIEDDYFGCAGNAGGSSHAEIHKLHDCLVARGWGIDFRNEVNESIDISRLPANYYLPFELPSADDFVAKLQSNAYREGVNALPPVSRAVSGPVTAQALPNANASVGNANRAIDPWQQMFPDSSRSTNGQYLLAQGPETRLFRTVKRHPSRLFAVAHIEGTAKRSMTYVELRPDGRRTIVVDIMWSKDDRLYGTQFRFTLFCTVSSQIDSVKVDIEEFNNPVPSAFFYIDAARQTILILLSMEAKMALPNFLASLAGNAWPPKNALGIALRYIANNP